jgi:hypothetical protein
MKTSMDLRKELIGQVPDMFIVQFGQSYIPEILHIFSTSHPSNLTFATKEKD